MTMMTIAMAMMSSVTAFMTGGVIGQRRDVASFQSMSMLVTEAFDAADIAKNAADAAGTVAGAVDSAAGTIAGAVDGAAGTVAGAVDAAIPVVKGAAQIGLGAASFGFEVTKKTVDIAGPVVIEGSKVALPAVAGGFRTLSYAIEHNGDMGPIMGPIDVEEVVGSPLAAALADAAPWALGLLVIYLGSQFAIQRAKDAAAELVPKVAAAVGLCAALTAAVQTGTLEHAISSTISTHPAPFAVREPDLRRDLRRDLR